MTDSPPLAAARARSAQRAALALVRCLGSGAVTLRVPALGAAPPDELGATAPQFAEVRLSPIVLRLLHAASGSQRRRWELLLPHAVVEPHAAGFGAESAEAWLRDALGVEMNGALLRIESLSAEQLAGVAYLYRAVLAE